MSLGPFILEQDPEQVPGSAVAVIIVKYYASVLFSVEPETELVVAQFTDPNLRGGFWEVEHGGGSGGGSGGTCTTTSTTYEALGKATGMAELIKHREMQLRLVVKPVTGYVMPTADAAASVFT
ncbi:hypothetical protein C6P41_001747 [Kluyveromyces marxianus]|nr:hypothetical protein C6P41_001747 [Kluyveromyces marxianus]